MNKNPNISYLNVLLNIAENDPKMTLVFVPSDIAFAKDELAEMRHKLSERERELGNDMHTAISNANAEAYRIVKAENEQLREANEQTWCAYCEKKYPRTPDSMEQIREHIATCEKHPMRKLEAEIRELRAVLDFHPRAEKLMRKEKPFLVVAIDEPYFKEVYYLIRANEMKNNSWRGSDEWNYERLIEDSKTA